MLGNFNFKKSSIIMLIICMSQGISAMTHKEQNKKNVSKLHRFLRDEDPRIREIIISAAIGLFLKDEESEIIRKNQKIKNNKLDEDYIKKYFEIKRSYYKDFFSNYYNKLSMTQLTHFKILICEDFLPLVLIRRLDFSNEVEDEQFLASYFIKQCQSNDDFKNHKAEFDYWVVNKNIEILSDDELDIKSDKVLDKRIKDFIMFHNIGSEESKSIINYDLKGNKETHENKLLKLFIENKLLFKHDRYKIIKDNEINLDIIKTHKDGLKTTFNPDDSHPTKTDTNIDFREKFINKLLLWFRDGQLEFKKNEDIADENMKKLIEDEKKEKAEKNAKLEALRAKKKLKKEARGAKKKPQKEERRKVQEEEERKKAQEEEEKRRKAQEEEEEKRRKAQEEEEEEEKRRKTQEEEEEEEKRRKAQEEEEEEEKRRKTQEEEEERRKVQEKEALRKAKEEALIEQGKKLAEKKKKFEQSIPLKKARKTEVVAPAEKTIVQKEKAGQDKLEAKRKAEEYRSLLDTCLRLEGSILSKIEALFRKYYVLEAKDFEWLIVIKQKMEQNIKNAKHHSFTLNYEVNNYVIELKGYEQFLTDIDNHYYLRFINGTNLYVNSLMKSFRFENEQNLNHIDNQGYYSNNNLWFPPQN